MRVQRKSDCFKYGNPKDHTQAEYKVMDFVKQQSKDKYWCSNEFALPFDKEFNKKEGIRSNYGHTYDIVVYDQDCNYKAFIEIDGEKHKKKTLGTHQQELNDQLAFRYLQEKFPKVKRFRLKKVEVNGEEADRQKYLKKELRRLLR